MIHGNLVWTQINNWECTAIYGMNGNIPNKSIGTYFYAWFWTKINEWRYTTIYGMNGNTYMGIYHNTWYECEHNRRYTIVHDGNKK